MSGRGEDILKQAIELPPSERAELIERLFQSFDTRETDDPSREAVDALWVRECEDRIAAYERGEMEAHSADEVFRRIDESRRR